MSVGVKTLTQRIGAAYKNLHRYAQDVSGEMSGGFHA